MNAHIKRCDWNHIHVSAGKTKFMLFGSKLVLQNPDDPVLLFKKTKIEKVRNYKYLGVTLDEQAKLYN